MNWTRLLFNELTTIVYKKYNQEFHGKREAWVNYLESVGINRTATFSCGRMYDEDGQIMMQCPHCLYTKPVYMTPSKLASKLYLEQALEIPKDLAEKILILGAMP